MRIDLPPNRPLAAMLLQGPAPAGASETVIATVLVKAAYDLVADGDGPRRMVPAPDPARAGIVTGDLIHMPAPGDPCPAPDWIDVAREADTALEKARTDIIVEGFTGAAAGPQGEIRVAGAVWFRRSPQADNPGDLCRNLFGWMPRSEAGRRIDVAAGFRPDPEAGDALPPAYGALFNNAYWRGAGGDGAVTAGDAFATPGDRNAAPLPMGAEVEIRQTQPDPPAPYRLRLPDTAFEARYRVHCGHGPDLPRHWRIGPVGPLVPDTLIVRPGPHAAEILWRASWAWRAEDPAAYRSLQVREAA